MASARLHLRNPPVQGVRLTANRPEGPKQAHARVAVRRRLLLGQVPREASKVALEKHFAQFGNVADIDVERDPRAVKNKAFGFVDFDDDAAVQAALAARCGGDHNVRTEMDDCVTIAVARAYSTDPRLFQPSSMPTQSQRPAKSCPTLRDLPPRAVDTRRGASANAAAAASGCAPRDPTYSDNSCAVYVVHDFDAASQPGEAERKAVIDTLRSNESALEDMDDDGDSDKTPAPTTKRTSATPAALARARARGALSRARPVQRGMYQNPTPQKKHPSELDRSTMPQSVGRVCPGDLPTLPLRNAPSKIDPASISQKVAALRGGEAPRKVQGNSGTWRRVVQVAIDHSKAVRASD